MQLERIHHVSINVDDVDESLAFYVGTLGLSVLSRPDLGFPGAWLALGAQQIHLLEVRGFDAPRGQHFAVQVDDIDAVIAELADRGVVASAPSEIPGVCRQVFITDPTGNLIEFNQPLP